MKKLLAYSLLCCLLIVQSLLLPLQSRATSYDEGQLDSLNQQIAQLTDSLNKSIAATKPLQSQLDSMQKQITQIKQSVAVVEENIVTKKKQIDRGYTDLAAKQKLLTATIRDFYIKSYGASPLLVLLSAKDASEATRNLAYQQAATNQDKTMITNLALSITDLETEKQQLTAEETQLTATKANLDEQSAKLNTIVVQAQTYQQSVSSQIATLSAKQQAILAAKLASLNIPTTAYTTQGGCSSDISVDPGFSPRFALFTYGVPNRVGMSQYGAKGRAEAGQSYNDILNAYYANMSITNIGTGQNVTANGTNDYGETFSNQSMNVEDYLKHIYEMPSSWPAEALKAQAIAARSYVMHAVSNGQTTVAVNQSFQEIKTELNAQSWVDAVNATAGQVMESNGTPITAWFSSTHGGYEFSSSDIGWSGTSWTKEMFDGTGSVNSFSDLQNNAYDKGSPWFYCDWGSRADYNHTAWLKPSELADIVNVVSLAKADGSTGTHLSQLDKPNPDGAETWNPDRVRQELHSRSLPAFSTISGASVDWNHGVGRVNSITFSGDAGSVSFDGSTFKSFFNLRAPASIQIVGPLYNVEQK